MSFLSSLFGVDQENFEAGQEADRRLAQLNEERAARLRDQGRIEESERYLQETQANLNRSRIDDVDAEIQNAFYEGLDEGAANIRGAISNTVGGALSTPFKILPLWLIVLGAAFAFFWFFGAPQFLKRP